VAGFVRSEQVRKTSIQLSHKITQWPIIKGRQGDAIVSPFFALGRDTQDNSQMTIVYSLKSSQ
jgi:hypothetical protein